MQHLLRFTNAVLQIMKMWDQQLLSKCLCRIDSQSVVSSQFLSMAERQYSAELGRMEYPHPPKHGPAFQKTFQK